MTELEILKKQLENEQLARMQAESALEKKAEELHDTTRQLRKLNEELEHKIAERTRDLEQSEKRYRQIIETANDIIYRINPAGTITYMNPVGLSKLGYSLREILGQQMIDFIHPDYQSIFDFESSQNEKKRNFSIDEFPAITKKGKTIWLSQHLHKIVSGGEITEFAAVARDVTERREAEQKLLSTQIRLSSLITNLHTGVLVEDENRQIVLTNTQFCDIFEIPIPPELLTGEDCSSYAEQSKSLFKYPDEFVDRIDEILFYKAPVIGEVIKMADGRILERDFVPIILEESYMGHLWQYRDITEEVTAQDKIRKSEEKYRGIIENMELGMMEVDNKGVVLRAYDRFCEMVGYTAEELKGKDAMKLLLPDEFIPVMKMQDEDRKRGKAGIYEIQLKHKSGDRKWVLISGAPILNSEGKFTGSIGIHYDITRQKLLQQELEEARNRAEEAQIAEQQFLANMSHEIRTPLNAIIGMAHLLYDTHPNEEQIEYLSVLKSSSEILRSLISDVLDLSKIRSGKFEIHPKEFDLAGLLKTLQKTFQLKLGEKPVDIVFNVDPDINHIVIGDDLLLNQIMLNLLSNAEKFTEVGNIHVSASLVKSVDETQTIRFEVTDTGIGIPDDKQELIFQSFRQVNGDIKRKFGGTGLGLSITKQLVEMQGGWITVTSKLGQGTTFAFELTYQDSGKIAASEQNQWKVSHDWVAPGKKILVVEDNYMNRKYISTLLKKWLFEYKMAVNGKEGLKMAQQEKFDMILMDIQMPEMDGYETTIAIRNTANPNQYTPIIVLTASAMISKKDKAFQIGMNDYVSKPFKPDQLLEIFQKYLPMENLSETEADEKSEEFRYHPKLDADLLNDMYNDDYEYAADMFGMFLNATVPDFNNIPPLIEKQEWTELGRLAHRLKPTFGMAGLSALQNKMQNLELMAKQNPDSKEISTLFQDIQAELNQMIPVLEQDFIALQKQYSKNDTQMPDRG